jgi:hypothetical protein
MFGNKGAVAFISCYPSIIQEVLRKTAKLALGIDGLRLLFECGTYQIRRSRTNNYIFLLSIKRFFFLPVTVQKTD